jgi:hypothetical protein
MVAFKKFFLTAPLLFSWAAASPRPLISEVKGLNIFDKRALYRTIDASKICENEFATKPDIANNNGIATVVDLTGCTALFFFQGDVLTSAYHFSLRQ